MIFIHLLGAGPPQSPLGLINLKKSFNFAQRKQKIVSNGCYMPKCERVRKCGHFRKLEYCDAACPRFMHFSYITYRSCTPLRSYTFADLKKKEEKSRSIPLKSYMLLRKIVFSACTSPVKNTRLRMEGEEEEVGSRSQLPSAERQMRGRNEFANFAV